MQYETAKIEDVMVIQPLPLGITEAKGSELPNLVGEFLGEGKKKFLLRLGRIPWLNSIGIGDLAAAYSLVMRAGGRTGFCEVQPRVMESFTNIGLHRAFDIHETPEEALTALGIECEDFAAAWERNKVLVRGRGR